MPYCPNCGTEVEENVKFCEKCGTCVENLPKPALDEIKEIPPKTVEQVEIKNEAEEKKTETKSKAKKAPTWGKVYEEWKKSSFLSRFVNGFGYSLIKIMKTVAEIMSFVAFLVAIAFTFKLSALLGNFLFGISFLSFVFFSIEFEKIIEVFIVRDMVSFLRKNEEYRNSFEKIMTSDVEKMSMNEGIKMIQMTKAYAITQNEMDDTSSLIMIILGSLLGFIGQVLLGFIITGCTYNAIIEKNLDSIWSLIGDLLGQPLFWVGAIILIAKFVLFVIEDKMDDAKVDKIALKIDKKGKEENKQEE